MAGVKPSRLLDAMLSRAVASRTENCCTPSRPGGIVGLPPPPFLPSVTLAPPSEAATVTPTPAPMNSRRLSFLLMPRLPPPGTDLRNRTRRAALDRSALIPLDRPRPGRFGGEPEPSSSSRGDQAERENLSLAIEQKPLTPRRQRGNLCAVGQGISRGDGAGSEGRPASSGIGGPR